MVHNKGSIKAMDILNNIPLTVEYFKTRPDVQQRIEKSINTNSYEIYRTFQHFFLLHCVL